MTDTADKFFIEDLDPSDVYSVYVTAPSGNTASRAGVRSGEELQISVPDPLRPPS